MKTANASPLLTVDDLKTSFFTEDGEVKSVNGVSLGVDSGETLAIVGESGSGKSVTSLSVMRLIPDPPGRIVSGSIRFRRSDGSVDDLRTLSETAMRKVRGNEIAMIFQEPMTSLNPVFTIGDQISEAVQLHKGLSRKEALDKALTMLELVEIPAAAKRLHEYPHQLSGGMRQRAMIALALSCSPSLLIADEPTTALDVTIQAQILDLMRALQKELGMGILFVTHNLGAVAEMADRVAVMYCGRIVEEGMVDVILSKPRHPYTRGLIDCLPGAAVRLAGEGEPPPLRAIPGQMASPANPPPGCAFAPRCFMKRPECEQAVPDLVTSDEGHKTRCPYYGEMP